MSDNNELDNFFSNLSDEQKPTEEAPKGEISSASLEDEFARLLNNFITGEDTLSSSSSTNKEETLALKDFITEDAESASENTNLSDFITQEETETSSELNLDNLQINAAEEVREGEELLKQEEQELSRAIYNFQDGLLAISDKKNLKAPTIDYEPKMLYPNYKPSVGRKFAQYLLESWDILNKYDPENMKRLSKNATDEEFLVFAESLTDTDMQLVIISYVEILINLEICEVKYEQMKEIAVKNRIKKELYEEYMRLQDRKNKFIEKLKQQNFPIDVDKLINNYFKAAQKDSKGAYDALTKNPAMYTPIEFDKIKPRFFGLIKVAPEDGIKFNQKIGNFIKKLKI